MNPIEKLRFGKPTMWFPRVTLKNSKKEILALSDSPTILVVDDVVYVGDETQLRLQLLNMCVNLK